MGWGREKGRVAMLSRLWAMHLSTKRDEEGPGCVVTVVGNWVS